MATYCSYTFCSILSLFSMIQMVEKIAEHCKMGQPEWQTRELRHSATRSFRFKGPAEQPPGMVEGVGCFLPILEHIRSIFRPSKRHNQVSVALKVPNLLKMLYKKKPCIPELCLSFYLSLFTFGTENAAHASVGTYSQT